MPEPLCVLIVKAEEDWRRSLAGIVESCGYRASEAVSGEQAMALLGSGQADILIADLDTPGKDGLALLSQIVEHYPHVPAIVVIDNGLLETAAEATRLGAYDYLLKPLSPILMESALRRAQAAVMCHKAEEEMALRSRELAALQRATNAITASLEPTQVLTTILVEIQQVLHADSASVLLLDVESGELVFRATSDALQKLVGLRLPPGRGAAGWSVLQNRSLLINDVSQNAHFYPGIDQITGYKTQNLMAVPLRVYGRTIGALEAVNKLEGTFSPRDLSLLESLALTAAAAIRNALLYQELWESRELLQAVLSSAGDGIAVVDRKGKILFHNPAADAMFGLPEGTAVGQDMAVLVSRHSESLKVLSPKESTLREYLDAALSSVDEERFVLQITSPGDHVLDTLMATVRYPSGEPRARLLVWHNITKEKEMERWREELGHIIVHDLRNPLSLARVGVEAAQMFLPADTNADALQGLSLALQGIAQLERKTEILLAVNRMETGGPILNVTPISISDLVAAAQAFYSFEAQERGIALTTDIPADPPMLYGDHNLLEWALGYLIYNAIKHSPNLGVVTIAARAEDNGVAISIRDTGARAPEEQDASVFDKFSHVQPVGDNSGLGLYFCKLAVEAHGGRISVESGVEEGRTFTVWLPLSPPKQVTVS